jgi:excisionase family DNA binding protein
MCWSFFNANPGDGGMWKQVLATSVAYGLERKPNDSSALQQVGKVCRLSWARAARAEAHGCAGVSPMDFHLLQPSEAALLVGVSAETILALIKDGKLGALRDQDEWWIPLKCLTLYSGDELKVDAACALAELVKQQQATIQSIAADTDAVHRIDGAQFPPGSVGTCLKQALIMFRRAHGDTAADAGKEKKLRQRRGGA